MTNFMSNSETKVSNDKDCKDVQHNSVSSTQFEFIKISAESVAMWRLQVETMYVIRAQVASLGCRLAWRKIGEGWNINDTV